MSDIIDKMAEQFTDLAELKTYSAAQYKTILELSKKINKLEEENAELKKQLLNSTPKDPSTESAVNSELLMGSNQEIIAKIQLNRFKEISMERELSLEESKKVEIFAKILFSMNNKDKQFEKETPKRLDDKELMALLEGINTG